ncbi:hypothetical protein BpHYR1_034636 [Brachionus plicatilis]|uniref:Uncharacterized protein n=1 Tax=Brachionus plicatilis TaxID=10195 RepID=A0A3M7R5Y0_BRAPC|nr:hypothetical protein BpHYR1_034636 [Brachionus plicatilis]
MAWKYCLTDEFDNNHNFTLDKINNKAHRMLIFVQSKFLNQLVLHHIKGAYKMKQNKQSVCKNFP